MYRALQIIYLVAMTLLGLFFGWGVTHPTNDAVAAALLAAAIGLVTVACGVAAGELLVHDREAA